MSKKSRVGRSGLLLYIFFFLLSTKPEIVVPGVIWYFEPHGKLNPGSIYIHGILNPLVEN
jgi:hypothetical protein